MTFLDEVRADREPLAHVLKKHRGIRRIVEDLYPDRAHFIYELLQNAEDAGANQASFALDEHSVSFEHDGRPFTQEDILGITDIGEGTKIGQEDKIGRFGVGFKAVFAYSETPHVWSPTFSFKISELVLPSEINARADLDKRTRFEFPFNNPKKNAPDAYAEVEAGLSELAETTLLFLSNLQSIRWQIRDEGIGEVLRIQHSENHIEVIKRTDNKMTASSHFLRFSGSVEGLEQQRISIAFALDCLPNVTAFDEGKALSQQLKIISANPGRVAVFFPAEKETSGLRFHLHAPFVPELSRASIKETPANEPLFRQLAKLSAASLHKIRELDLLSGDFLSVLPNPQDVIPSRYQLIRSAIIDEMNEHPLTPTFAKSHAPAKRLLQGKASLKDLLAHEDIEFLVDYDDEPPEWALGASQRNSNVDRFLSALAIKRWDIDEFIRLLEAQSSDEPRYIAALGKYVAGPDEHFMRWLAAKPVEWHQRLYSLLFQELTQDAELNRLKFLKIVRLSDGSYSTGKKCYFPTDDIEHDEFLPRVSKGVFLSGKNKTQQIEARKLLEKIDVGEVGEADQVRAILQQRYTAAAFKPDMKDLKRFIALVEQEPAHAALFADFFIFERTDEKWGQPSQTYLDSPICETGLRVYYDALGGDAPRKALAPGYATTAASNEKLRKFAEAVGAQTHLEIVATTCHNNPQWDYLSSVPGERYTSTINQDFTIPGLDALLAKPTIELAKLVWRTMCSLPRYSPVVQARYQKNSANGSRYAHSQLIHTLRTCAWIPQADGVFVGPVDADRNLLPNGFPFDGGDEWIEKVEFGQGSRRRAEESQRQQISVNTAAKELGFKDADTVERARKFIALPLTEQNRILSTCAGIHPTNLPDHEPSNPQRRAERVAQRAAAAPVRNTETRSRSVSVGLDDVKQEVGQYLRQQYTNTDEEMICQVCKSPLPFKLDDGSYYFEKVEFLSQLNRWHRENYLALCPNHSAMFQYANASQDSMKELFLEMSGNELTIILAQADVTLYFTKTHIADLRTVIEVDGKPQD